MKKILLILMMLVGTALSAQAQVDEVTLVVSGEGVTKDEATTKALRSAIEQSFGVFVSASTEILNDELVRDEIATVSSGNIKKYTELGAIQLQNGKTEVTLQATVSIKKTDPVCEKSRFKCRVCRSGFCSKYETDRT